MERVRDHYRTGEREIEESICGYRVLRIESYDFPGSGDCFRSYRPSVTLTESRKSAQSIFDRRQTAIVAGYVHFSPPRKCPLTSFDHAFPGEHRASTSRHDSLRGEILLLRQFLISQDWFSPLVVNSERCRLCLFNFILTSNNIKPKVLWHLKNLYYYNGKYFKRCRLINHCNFRNSYFEHFDQNLIVL